MLSRPHPSPPLVILGDSAPFTPLAQPVADLLTQDTGVSPNGEASMDLGTPLEPFRLLDPQTLERRHLPLKDASVLAPSEAERTVQMSSNVAVVDPCDVPLPSSPPPESSSSFPFQLLSPFVPTSSFPARPASVPPPQSRHPPSGVSTDPTVSDRILTLQSDLLRAHADIARRDVALEELRTVVDRLRGELGSVHGPVV